jgi:hypothetical protein
MPQLAVLARTLLIAAVAGEVFLSPPAAAQQSTDETQSQPAQPAEKPLAPAPRRDRVYPKDVEGTWVTRDYLERLRASRAPHHTARQAPGIAITIQADGSTWPITVTNFQRAQQQFVLEVQPDVKPKSYRLMLAAEDRPGLTADEVSYLYFRGERGPSGQFDSLSFAEPTYAKKRYLTYVRLTTPLESYVNRAVIAGEYRDAEGRDYQFTEGGEAILPDRKFDYEVSLDPKTATCELLVSHRAKDPNGTERIGFRWEGKELRLYGVTGSKPPYKCSAKPIAVLTRK